MTPLPPDDYEVLGSHSRTALASEVRAKIQQGYSLHGDLIVKGSEQGLWYVQAVARYYEYCYPTTHLPEPEGS